MSFTTDIYTSIANDIKTKPGSAVGSMAMRLITYANQLQSAFAINKNTELRSIYLSVDNSAKKTVFPKWKGVSIEIAKLPDYGNDKTYVAMKELPSGAGYIFEIVAEDLRKSIEDVQNPSSALGVITDVLSKWKSFFQYDGEVLLSEIRQQGLMGELYFLSDAIKQIGLYAVAKWSGCNDETHDFYFDDHGVEIKTTSSKEPYYAHISSEYQLDVMDVSGSLFLKFYALRKSKSSGMTLPQMVEQIRETLVDSSMMLVQFNEKLHKYGYYDELAELYNTGYYIRDDYQFEIKEGFPCIVPSALQCGISKVEYSLGIDHCTDYFISDEMMFKILKGENTDAE